MVRHSEWDSTARRTAPQQGLRLKCSPTCINARYHYAVATVRLSVSVVYLSAQSRMPNTSTFACFHTNLQSAQGGRRTTPQQLESSVPSYTIAFACPPAAPNLRIADKEGYPDTMPRSHRTLPITMRGNRPRTATCNPFINVLTRSLYSIEVKCSVSVLC